MNNIHRKRMTTASPSIALAVSFLSLSLASAPRIAALYNPAGRLNCQYISVKKHK
jgi:hypothetical protein